MTTQTNESDRLWAAIDADKRRDRLVRRAAIAGWGFTFLFTIAFAVMIGFTMVNYMRRINAGAMAWEQVVSGLRTPVIVLGSLSLLIAIVSTIGVFLRMRTTTLNEIQLRLAALERALATPHRD